MSFKSKLSYASLLLFLTGIVTPNLILSTPSSVTAQSVWRPFSPHKSGFSILMPGTPKAETETSLPINFNGKDVKITEYSFTSDRTDQDGTIYMVSYSDFPANYHGLFGSTLEEQVENSLKFVSTLIESRSPGIMQRKQLLRLNGNPGMEMKFAIPEKGQSLIMWIRTFSVPRPNNQIRSYQIAVVSTKEQSLKRTLDGFFKSFKLIKL